MIESSNCDVGILLGDAAARAQKQPVAELEDVGFVNAGDALAALVAGRFEGELRDPLGGVLGDDAQTFDDAGHDFVLEAAVQAFGVFADDDQVDVFVARRHAGHRPGRPIVGVQLQLLPQLDVDAAKAGAAGRRGRAFERGVGVLHGGERFRRQRRADCIERRLAGEVRFPFEIEARGVDDTLRSRGDFGADAVAGDEDDAVGHARSQSVEGFRVCRCSRYNRNLTPEPCNHCKRSNPAQKRGPVPALGGNRALLFAFWSRPR